MADRGTFATILGETGQALLPLQRALETPEAFLGLMVKLGWDAPAVPAPLQQVGTGLTALFETLQRILGDGLQIDGSISLEDDATAGAAVSVSPDDIVRGVDAVRQVIGGIRAIASAPDAAFPPHLVADGFKQKLPRQLVDHLLVTYLHTYHGGVAFALRALGVIKATYVERAGQRLPYIDYTFDLADLPKVLESPSVVLQNAFGWGGPDFDAEAFLSQVDDLLQMIAIDTRIERLSPETADALEGTPQPDAPPRRMLRGVIFERARGEGTMSADLRLIPLPARGPDQPGLCLMPAFNGLLDVKMQLFDDIAVTIRTDLKAEGGIALLMRPGRPLETVVGFAAEGAPVSASGSIDVRAERSSLDDAPTILLGSPSTTRLQFKKIGGGGGVRISGDGTADLFAELELKGLEFRIDTAESDGFISTIVPGNGIGFSTDLAVGFSNRQGIYFRGTSNLEIALPVHVQLGPIEVQGLTIAANPRDGKLPITLGATLKGALGPLTAVVENIGLTATFAFPPNHDGNLGPVDLRLGFKPPNGVGLSIDAGVVKGGGYLYVDADRGEYAGALELTFAEFLSIKAIGLITTKMPDGSKGFSLLIIMTVEFGTGLQLGFGFTLLAVGGLIGLNRTMNLEALLQGVRTGGLTTVMFPKDIIANAPEDHQRPARLLPAAAGHLPDRPDGQAGLGHADPGQRRARRDHRDPRQHRHPRRASRRPPGRRHRHHQPAGELRRRHRVRQAAHVLLRRPVRVAHRLPDHRGRDGPARRVGRRRQLRPVASAASTRSSRRRRCRSPARSASRSICSTRRCAGPRRRLLRRHLEHGAVRRPGRGLLRPRRLQRARASPASTRCSSSRPSTSSSRSRRPSR